MGGCFAFLLWGLLLLFCWPLAVIVAIFVLLKGK
jgi:hypothetical protein